MKRLILWLLVFLVVFPMAGCKKTEEIQDPVRFYYRRANIEFGGEDSVVAAETRDAYGLREDLQGLLQLYISGPETETLVNVFPKSVAVMSVLVEDTTAVVQMNRSFAQLGGIQMSVACVCLSKTVMEITGVETVRIYVEKATLAGEQYLEFDKDTVLLEDDGAGHTKETTAN